MMWPLSKVIILLITTAVATEACLFKVMPAEKSLKNHWDYLEIPRKIDKSCECGKFDPKKWNLYVHVKSGDHEKTCTGTIITSNLVVTSHKCLELEQKRMRIYDLLKLKMENIRSMADVEQVTVTDTKVAKPDTVNFKVVDIFYNPQYAISSEKKLFPENDLVLIKVEEDLLKHPKGFTPICVPFYDKEKIGNVKGFYYGHTTGNNVQQSDIPSEHSGVILEKRECYEELLIRDTGEEKEDSFDKTLCFKCQEKDNHTGMEGGPLIYTGSSSSTAYLMGVATVIAIHPAASGLEASAGQDQAYFASIKPLVKFIEFYADQGNDKWCDTPKLSLGRITAPTEPSFRTRAARPWPWDELKEPIQREESLNCVCGLQTSKSFGRIVGGSEVANREYGWMAVLIFYQAGRDGSGALCGGSIINDRVILTAAHCVVDDKKISKGLPRVHVDPNDIDVTLNAHTRRDDPKGIKVKVAAVLFHPDYVGARKEHYYEKDVALLILKEKLKFPEKGPGLRPICLHKPGPYVNLVGKKSTVTGWGMTDPNERTSISDKLNHIELPIIDLSECRDISRSTVTDNFLCAGTLNRYKDAASGDSGGPLMIQDEQTDQWIEVGIVSYGEDVYNHPTKTAALYSDVQKLLPFIDYHSQRVGAQWCKSEL